MNETMTGTTVTGGLMDDCDDAASTSAEDRRDRWLVYVVDFRGPSPQVLHVDAGSLPVLDEGIRNRVLAPPRKMAIAEHRLSLNELAAKYPPVAAREVGA